MVSLALVWMLILNKILSLFVAYVFSSDAVVFNFVVTAARAFSSPFWKQMEPFFGLICEEDITYWKQKVLIFFCFQIAMIMNVIFCYYYSSQVVD